MKEKYVAYVGTYTHGSSIGIHLYDVNVEEGTMTERKVVPVNNSSHLAISVNGKYLYSIADEGVAVFAIEPDGDLTFINKVGIDGMRAVEPGQNAIRIVPGLDPDGLHRLAVRLSEATTGLCAALTPNDKGTGYCLAQAGGDVRAHNVQRQVQLGRGQHRYRAVLHRGHSCFYFFIQPCSVKNSRMRFIAVCKWSTL